MRARAVLLLTAVLAVLVLAPSAALGQGDAFQPLPTPEQPAPTTPQQPAQPDPDDGLSSTDSLLIALAAIALIALIWFAILRDARGAAPADSRPRPVDADGLERDRPKGSKAPPQRRASQSRQRAKHARQARKRNRPA